MIGGKIIAIKERENAHIRLALKSDHPDDVVNECYVKIAWKPGLAALLQPGDTIWWYLGEAHIRMAEGHQTIAIEKIGPAYRDLEAPAGSSAEEEVEYLGAHPGTALFRLTPRPTYNLLRNGETVRLPLDAVGFDPGRVDAAFHSVIARASKDHPHAALFEMAVQDLLRFNVTQPL